MSGLQGPIHKVEIGHTSFTVNLNTLEFISFQEVEDEPEQETEIENVSEKSQENVIENEGLISIYLIGRTDAIEFVCDKQSYSNLFTRWKNFITQERDIFMSNME